MKKIILLLCFLFTILFNQSIYSQSSNFIAQGHYYKAKELYEKKLYKDAIKYVQYSKENLQGTNYQLQYLHIMSLYANYNFTEAKKEMETYFQILEKETLAKGFTKYVERLTDDETKALSKIMIDIMENAKMEEKKIPINRLNVLLSKAYGKLYNHELISFTRGYVVNAYFTLDGDLIRYNATYCSQPKPLSANYPKYYRILKKNVVFKKNNYISVTPQEFRSGDVVEINLDVKVDVNNAEFGENYLEGSNTLRKEFFNASTENRFYIYVLREDIVEIKQLLNQLRN